MSVSEAALRIRRATPADAPLIAGLYREAYTPPSGGDAREHYPFPQFLDSKRVAEVVARPGVCWIVAQAGGQIVGSAGALRNIGSDADRVAEVYGIVVDPQFRGRRIGSGLLTELCREMGDHPQFVLCESRTAVSAGWRVARNCGFRPLGFEPFAHATPAGSEAMLLTGRIAQNALNQRTILPSLTAASRAMAAGLVVELRGLSPEDASGALAGSGADLNGVRQVGDPIRRNAGNPTHRSPISVIRDDKSGTQIAADLVHDGLHHSGIVSLRRLEGEDLDGCRYDRQYYVAREGLQPVACLLVVLDRVDRRARILEMQTSDGGGHGELLAFVLAALEADSRDRRLSVVVDVCANAQDLQRTLERLEFLPTVYYPSLVAQAGGRVDAIQYTRLLNAEFEASLSYTTELSWPEARQIVSQVQCLWTQQRACPTSS